MGRISVQLVLALVFVAVWLGAAAGIACAQALPSISIHDVTVDIEGRRGSSVVSFTISLSQRSTSQVSVILSTRDVTATGGGNHCGQPFDYLIQENVGVAIFPGDSTASVEFLVPICGDAVDEADEIFEVVLFGPTNATIADSVGVGTILDDDNEPQLSIDDNKIKEGDSGTSILEFTVELSDPSGKPVTVDLATSSVTATGGATCTSSVDFLDVSSTLTFQPGETAKTVTVSVCGDTDAEPGEDFFVNLSNATNATIQIGRGTGTIRSDEKR